MEGEEEKKDYLFDEGRIHETVSNTLEKDTTLFQILEQAWDDEEIDLSRHFIGDKGCSLLLSTRPLPTTLRSLDLESNGLSPHGGTILASALCDATPNLTYLDLGCNGIGGVGAEAIAVALSAGCCPVLSHLDLHGNAIGDTGCRAIGEMLGMGEMRRLEFLDLSANRIEDDGCRALAPLFGGVVVGIGVGVNSEEMVRSCGVRRIRSCCPLLTDINLRENGIESITSLLSLVSHHQELAWKEEDIPFAQDTLDTPLPLLTFLDLSWNCIADLGPLSDALTGVHRAGVGILSLPALKELDLRGNGRTDVDCRQLNMSFKDSGATPLLECYDGGEVEMIEKEDDTGEGVRVLRDEGGEGRLRRCLRLLADGNVTNQRVCGLALWQNTALPTTHIHRQLTPTDPQAAHHLRRDGFVIHPPLCPRTTITSLATILDSVERAGWPPVFCFMNDSVWDFVATQVWPTVHALMGVDCVLDAGSAFAWSLRPTGRSTYPRNGEFRKWQNAVVGTNATERVEGGHIGIGSSFGLPHRDYSGIDSIRWQGQEKIGEGVVDDPNMITVWIPLNDATLENGCMYVVPREFDTGFAKTDDHAHMNPATEVQRGLSSKIHFPLHGARALPAPAGSLLAWYGNTIHWGSSCSRYADHPRKSIALTFYRADIVAGKFRKLESILYYTMTCFSSPRPNTFFPPNRTTLRRRSLDP